MFENFFSYSYNFTFDEHKFEVDIDDSLSAVERNKKYPNLQQSPLHSHPMHEFFFVFDSPLYIETDEGETEYKNCIVMVPPRVEHRATRTNDYRFLFSCSIKDSRKTPFTEFMKNILAEDKIFVINQMTDEVKTYLDELNYITETQKDEIGRDLSISVLKLIFHHIFTFFTLIDKRSDDSYVPSDSYYLIIAKTISYYPQKNVNLATIADALHLSQKQTSRIIKKYYGKSLSEVLLDERLKYAKSLLKSSSLSVSEIATSSRFHSENYFYQCFKRKYGCTPLKYRKLNK